MAPLRVIVGTICTVVLLAGRGIWTATVPLEMLATNDTAGTTTISLGSRLGTLGSAGPMADNEAPAGEDLADLIEGQTDQDWPSDPSTALGAGIDDQLLDVYGNEIEIAFEDYRIDLRGDIYERHSPDTAVQRLGAAGV